MQVKTLHTTFNLPLHSSEIRNWRGAFVEMAGRQYDLFHNHLSDKEYQYRYPLVQYRTDKQQASILVFNQAIQSFQKILAESDWTLNWKRNPFSLTITQLNSEEHELSMSPHMLPYQVNNWLALKQDNYLIWQKCKNMTERSQLLERVLVGHLLGFATQMGWKLPERLEVNLLYLHQIKQINYRGNPVLAFDISFEANIELPNKIGLGKGLSLGYGVLNYGKKAF